MLHKTFYFHYSDDCETSRLILNFQNIRGYLVHVAYMLRILFDPVINQISDILLIKLKNWLELADFEATNKHNLGDTNNKQLYSGTITC